MFSSVSLLRTIVYIPLEDVGMISMQFRRLHHRTHTFACRVHPFHGIYN